VTFGGSTIDYIDVKTKKKRRRRRKNDHRVKRDLCQLIGLIDAFFFLTPIITPKQRALQPRDAFENTPFKLEFEIVQI
jgi:hypothetical protein